MSVTTPKRNEAVARLKITALGRAEWSAHEHESGQFVLYSDYAALQAELSRLREVVADGLAFLTSEQWGTTGYMDDDVYDDARDLAKKFRANLEPQTDGR